MIVSARPPAIRLLREQIQSLEGRRRVLGPHSLLELRPTTGGCRAAGWRWGLCMKPPAVATPPSTAQQRPLAAGVAARTKGKSSGASRARTCSRRLRPRLVSPPNIYVPDLHIDSIKVKTRDFR